MKRVIGYREVLRQTFNEHGNLRKRLGYEPIYEDLGVTQLTTMEWDVERVKPPMDANRNIWGKER